MKSTTQLFGQFQNQDIHLYTLENDNGMLVKMMDFGATITSITIPGKDDKPVSIACGFDSFDEYFADVYKANAPYFGCTVGRYCSQIKDAKFSLNGVDYQLAANCGDNNLHGGMIGFDKKIWKAKPIGGVGKVGVVFTLISDDMEEGFPGTVKAEVTIELSNDNELILNYKAVSDRDTPLSMTNHTYFNLSGFERSVERFKVQVLSNKRLLSDDTGACLGEVTDVTDTLEDLRNGRIIKDVHESIGDGFEHFYLFDYAEETLSKVARVSDEQSGRTLEVYSTEPCMLFYTGKYTSNELQRSESEKYGKYQGFCCETHRWPNGPNISGSPKSITKAGEEFKSTTVFKLRF
ncbi:galactose mutarotase [Carboxylicivirga sediminis]|uniref:Aldose 1-epimerase n=1 Tax=Carboxylicivirga sediminis TaxID=2006564 RepID=A0A941F0C4_9BACT|nr:aldose epimerase family protein [Carboxylicivirga sediminis]MBR8534034.1 galactose mutarotase [Carboxylicivirga sediminis]